MMVFRLSRSLPLALLAMLALSSCATRQPKTGPPLLALSSTVVWRVSEGDQVEWRVWQFAELSGKSIVGTDGAIYCIGLGRVKVAGLSLDSLQLEIAGRYAKVIIDPAVDVVLYRDVVVYGQGKSLGIVIADPGMTVIALLAKAAVQAGQFPIVTLVKGDGRQFSLPREARLGNLDITRTDAVYVVDESFLNRNSQKFSGIATATSLLTSIISVVLLIIK